MATPLKTVDEFTEEERIELEISSAAIHDRDLWVFAPDIPGQVFRRYSSIWRNLVRRLWAEGRCQESDRINDYGFRRGFAEV